MTETLLGLVPDYGAIVVAAAVFLACLAVPLPASILVLTAGSFAAVGDLSIASVGAAVFGAYVAGDQAAYLIASTAGRHILPRLRARDSLAPVLDRSETLIRRHGALAVLLSHTLLSPLCPYVSYLSGAGGLAWARFTLSATAGALIWTGVYLGLGTLFATQLEQVASLLANFLGVILAAALGLGSLVLLRRRWRQQELAD